MSQTPVPRDPGRDENPPGVPPWPDWMDDPAYLAGLAEDEDLGYDPGDAPPPDVDHGELIAEAERITMEQAREAVVLAGMGLTAAMAADAAAAAGRRGPGMPGSAASFPGVYASRASGFASGQPLDVAPGCTVLAQFAEQAAGDDDRYPGASDDELLGAIAAWDRAESYMAARKHAAVAELIRRRPAAGCAPQGPARMPEAFDEFVPRELGSVLGESRAVAGDILSLAYELEVSLPGTKAAFRSGILNQRKSVIIAAATCLLDPDEARAAEAKVLDRAGSLTSPGLRAAISGAVMDVAPDKAKQRREHAAKRARVERWAEASGNAGLAGRELPPAEVAAADQRVTWWAKQLKKAGLDGGMDTLRARALLDILLGTDSRPPGVGPDSAPSQPGTNGQPGMNGQPGDGGTGPGLRQPSAPAGPLAGVIPPGFAGRIHLTTPLATLTGLADRPGEMTGIGPIDPDLARDLAFAAARSQRSTWCLTVTDQDGHAVGHGCARPAPASRRENPAKRNKPDTAGGPDPPGIPRFTFTATDLPGPEGGYGTWKLATGIPGQRDLLIALGPIPVGDCDHRHEAKGHDPGVMLRHLAQVRHATCTGPGCRRPSTRADFEHNIPYEAGGRTCLCNGNPTCRHDHRVKQDPRWKVDQLPGGYVRWTTPSGRQFVTEPTRYPI